MLMSLDISAARSHLSNLLALHAETAAQLVRSEERCAELRAELADYKACHDQGCEAHSGRLPAGVAPADGISGLPASSAPAAAAAASTHKDLVALHSENLRLKVQVQQERAARQHWQQQHATLSSLLRGRQTGAASLGTPRGAVASGGGPRQSPLAPHPASAAAAAAPTAAVPEADGSPYSSHSASEGPASTAAADAVASTAAAAAGGAAAQPDARAPQLAAGQPPAAAAAPLAGTAAEAATEAPPVPAAAVLSDAPTELSPLLAGVARLPGRRAGFLRASQQLASALAPEPPHLSQPTASPAPTRQPVLLSTLHRRQQQVAALLQARQLAGAGTGPEAAPRDATHSLPSPMQLQGAVVAPTLSPQRHWHRDQEPGQPQEQADGKMPRQQGAAAGLLPRGTGRSAFFATPDLPFAPAAAEAGAAGAAGLGGPAGSTPADAAAAAAAWQLRAEPVGAQSGAQFAAAAASWAGREQQQWQQQPARQRGLFGADVMQPGSASPSPGASPSPSSSWSSVSAVGMDLLHGQSGSPGGFDGQHTALDLSEEEEEEEGGGPADGESADHVLGPWGLGALGRLDADEAAELAGLYAEVLGAGASSSRRRGQGQGQGPGMQPAPAAAGAGGTQGARHGGAGDAAAAGTTGPEIGRPSRGRGAAAARGADLAAAHGAALAPGQAVADLQSHLASKVAAIQAELRGLVAQVAQGAPSG